MQFVVHPSIVLDSSYLIKSVAISSEEKPKFSDDFKLSMNKIVLPFHLVDGYMLIDGEINGKNGKFMFDTGNPFGVFINNHFIELEKKEVSSRGKTGSGQALDVYLNSIILNRKIKIT